MLPEKKLHTLKLEDFDRLLKWLDPNPEQAGLTYEEIRWRLIAILMSRGCRTAEELADEVIDRVTRRLVDIQETYVGEKVLYFLGVMNNVHHEYLKRPVMPRLPVRDDDAEMKQKNASLLGAVFGSSGAPFTKPDRSVLCGGQASQNRIAQTDRFRVWYRHQ